MKIAPKNTLLFVLFLLVGFVTLMGFQSKQKDSKYRSVDIGEFPVETILIQLGDSSLNHSMSGFDSEKASLGEDLIRYGRTKKAGKYSKRISKYFVCTDCHNLKREFNSLSSESSSERLTYAKNNGIPFLPGSTLSGVYNRTKFYNDDYIKKYGPLVENSRDTLANAIQLCAKYCASGLYLEEWELEAFMHYFKKNELKIKDLDLSENNLKNIQRYSLLKEDEKSKLIELIKSSYRQSYAAHFLKPIDTGKRLYGEGGDVENGKLIYRKSCLHCHGGRRVTYLNLDESQLTARMFWNNITNYTDKSLYQIVRYGTYAKTGRKQYMPLYTKEKMSDEQLNDLVAYIKKTAEK